MRWYVVAVVAFVALAAGLALPQFVRFRGAAPEILLSVCVFLSLYGKPQQSLLACLGCGLMKDFFSTGRVGTYAIIFFIVGLSFCGLRRYIYRERILTQVAVNFAASFICNLLYLAVLRVFVSAYSLSECWRFIIVVSLYTGCISPIIFFLLGRLKGYLGLAEPRIVFS